MAPRIPYHPTRCNSANPGENSGSSSGEIFGEGDSWRWRSSPKDTPATFQSQVVMTIQLPMMTSQPLIVASELLMMILPPLMVILQPPVMTLRLLLANMCPPPPRRLSQLSSSTPRNFCA